MQVGIQRWVSMTTQTGNARRSAAEINDNGAPGRDADGFPLPLQPYSDMRSQGLMGQTNLRLTLVS